MNLDIKPYMLEDYESYNKILVYNWLEDRSLLLFWLFTLCGMYEISSPRISANLMLSISSFKDFNLVLRFERFRCAIEDGLNGTG